ncbi:MAG: hypothetical protein DI539_07235 [Flavobacterium psychrophilum]|nr:MAG: hypothetical protein DI539_07235 [Flavobacterium psychrophilum]
MTEGIDECDTAKTKTNKNNGFLCYEYLMPSNICLAHNSSDITIKSKSFIDNPLFNFGYYGKIHLPPPELI